MISSVLLLGLSLAARVWALPSPQEALQGTAAGPGVAYSAELIVTRQTAKGSASKRVRLTFAPPSSFRREVLGRGGEVARLIVSDGKAERLYDPARKRLWEGEAAEPLYKRLGPDEELERLGENYDASLGTGPVVAGRPTWLLELRPRSDRHARRRLWVDREHALVLKSETYRPDGSLAAVMRFEKVSFGREVPASAFRLEVPKGVKTVRRAEPDYLALEEARGASGMEARVPAWLPPGYVFESLDVLPHGNKSVLHYRFSDGVDVLSLFQCPPRVRLGFGDHPRRRVKVGAGRGTASWSHEGSVLGWGSGGQRFILVGPLPQETLVKVAESVP